VALYGEFSYNSTKWRPSVPFEDQLKALQELIDEGKVILFYLGYIPNKHSSDTIFIGWRRLNLVGKQILVIFQYNLCTCIL
jgi:hypothetical protein